MVMAGSLGHELARLGARDNDELDLGSGGGWWRVVVGGGEWWWVEKVVASSNSLVASGFRGLISTSSPAARMIALPCTSAALKATW